MNEQKYRNSKKTQTKKPKKMNKQNKYKKTNKTTKYQPNKVNMEDLMKTYHVPLKWLVRKTNKNHKNENTKNNKTQEKTKIKIKKYKTKKCQVNGNMEDLIQTYHVTLHLSRKNKKITKIKISKKIKHQVSKKQKTKKCQLARCDMEDLIQTYHVHLRLCQLTRPQKKYTKTPKQK